MGDFSVFRDIVLNYISDYLITICAIEESMRYYYGIIFKEKES